MRGISKIKELIKLSLKGELELDDLYSKWPEDFSEEELFEMIYCDIESHIEHLPSKINYRTDNKFSKDYKLLLLDLIILEHVNFFTESSKIIFGIRKNVINGEVSNSEMEELVKKVFK